MKHFINLKDISSKDLRKIITDAKKRKNLRKNLSTLEVDKGSPLKGKLLIQMFEKSSLRTRISFYLAIKQLGGSTLTLRPDELHLSKGGESIEDTAKILSNFGNAFMLRTDDDKKTFISACKFVGFLTETKEEWLIYKKKNASLSEKEIEEKINERNKAREEKNYQKADEIRNELLDKGVLIEDKDDKTVWKFK